MFGDLTAMFNISRQMIEKLNTRIKNWTLDTCIADVFILLSNCLQVYTNYANNYDTIFKTIDKLNSSNPHFHEFLTTIDNTPLTKMMT
jgi:hypothetical protein